MDQMRKLFRLGTAEGVFREPVTHFRFDPSTSTIKGVQYPSS